VAYDQDLADRLRLLLGGENLSEKKMFGGLAFLTNGHMAVAVSGQGGIMVRVDPAETDALLNEPGAGPFEMHGRPMKGWLRVDAAALDDDAVLRAWAERGLAYARTLPPK
jgi:TfoX/Sxy family transcriptional regulator of competence genes